MDRKAGFLSGRVRVWGLITAAGIMAAAGTVLGFFGWAGWVPDLFSHFRVQYFLMLGAAALLLLIPKKHKTATVFGLLAAVNLSLIAPFYLGNPAGASSVRPSHRLLLLNVSAEFGDMDRVRDVIQRFDPDIVVLLEVDEKWIAGLQPIEESYAHTVLKPQQDNFGIALYSRLPIARSGILYIGDAGVPSLLAMLSCPDGEFRVLATHPLPPISAGYARRRNDQLEKLSAVITRTGSPVLMSGDLNASPWSYPFRRLLERTGLKDSSRGRGVQPTWPAFLPLFLIPIDHVLHSAEIEITGKKIGPGVGSDHYPVIVDFKVRSM